VSEVKKDGDKERQQQNWPKAATRSHEGIFRRLFFVINQKEPLKSCGDGWHAEEMGAFLTLILPT
jgi:hypothetical protein